MRFWRWVWSGNGENEDENVKSKGGDLWCFKKEEESSMVTQMNDIEHQGVGFGAIDELQPPACRGGGVDKVEGAVD